MHETLDSPRVILASGSPRRAALLEQIGVTFTAIDPDIDESTRPGEDASTLVERLARAKAEALSAAYPGAVIVGADTVVTLDGAIFGKPDGQAEAAAMLGALSGKTHQVASGVAVVARGSARTRVNLSRVAMRHLTSEDIASYWACGEPRDKAGGYAIQGRGALFVEHLEGSYSAVMGLALFETAALLKEAGYDVLAMP